MDVKLESLIEKIKKDGVEEAKKASDEIINKARLEAETIIEQAQALAKEAKKQAESSAARLENNAKDSFKRAARDLILALKNELVVLFDRILKDNIAESLTPGFMNELIAKIIDKWSSNGDVIWEVLISKSDREKLEKLLLASLKKQAEAGMEVKISKAIDKGFRIGIKGEDVHYDFTDQSILEGLKQLLNPSLYAMLDVSNG